MKTNPCVELATDKTKISTDRSHAYSEYIYTRLATRTDRKRVVPAVYSNFICIQFTIYRRHFAPSAV
jgi:hypothetical protein